MPFLGAALLPNAYDLLTCDISVRVAVTNKSCSSPARSFGAFPTRFALDRCIDMVAHRLGLEPADVRRQNLIAKLPYTTCTGLNYDASDWLKTWDNLVSAVDLAGFRKTQLAAREEGRFFGIGFAVGAEVSGAPSEAYVQMANQPGYGSATVRLDPRGKALVFHGDAPSGQSHETTLSQVAAQEFGIHPDDVFVTIGDTGTTPFGCGTNGSRQASYTVSGVAEACRVLKAKMDRFMIHDFELSGATPGDFDYRDGEVIYRRDSNIRRTLAEQANRIIMAPINMPEGEQAGLEHTAYFEADAAMWSFSAQAAIVEVDPATGQFRIERYVTSEDVGTVINPLVVEGQVQGRVVQGISNACFEEFAFDENGQHLSADFENYQIARALRRPRHHGDPRRHAVSAQSAWHARPRRGHLRARAGRARQRHFGCAAAVRRRGYRAAPERQPRLRPDPAGQGQGRLSPVSCLLPGRRPRPRPWRGVRRGGSCPKRSWAAPRGTRSRADTCTARCGS